jgi:hypothetical protein
LFARANANDGEAVLPGDSAKRTKEEGIPRALRKKAARKLRAPLVGK